MKKITIGLLIALVVIFAIVLLAFPLMRRPYIANTPLFREMAKMHQLSSKFVFYSDEHSALPTGETMVTNVTALVVAGILSTNDADYLRENHYDFLGYDFTQTNEVRPLFKTILTNTRIPRRIVGYSDGHAEIQYLTNAP